jgi:hypothetical protein
LFAIREADYEKTYYLEAIKKLTQFIRFNKKKMQLSISKEVNAKYRNQLFNFE